MSYFSQYLPVSDPTLIFFVVLLVILFSPIVMGRLRIPHIIGMVLAGIVLGQYGLNILERDASFELFGSVGLYYIMFLAGLEMDMEGLKRNRSRVTSFGLLTFFTPLILTTGSCVWLLGYSPMASLLIGCLMASNTLVAYPIVGRYGLTRHVSSTLSVGGSMVSLFLALLVMAAVVNSFNSGAGWSFWLLFTVKLTAFCAGLIFAIPRLARWFLRKYSDSVMQFIFTLAVMFLSAAMSDAVGLEGIFGAFFSGLVLNRFIPKVSPLMSRIEFTGNALFIPYFLIGVGMLIDIRLLIESPAILWIVACITFFGTAGKAVAAYFSAWIFKLSVKIGTMMFGLTSAHAAGAIAIVMVGRSLPTGNGTFLFNDEILNCVVIMILFACIISTLVTEHAARQLRLENMEEPEMTRPKNDEKILIPVKYPEYAENLISLATMMRNPKLRRELAALNVVYDDTNADRNREEGRRLLEHLQQEASAIDVPMATQIRIDTNIANGIRHAFKELQASEIIMGLHSHKQNNKGFWGEFTQSLYNGLSCQIIIARIIQPLNTIRRVQVVVPSRAEYEPGFYRWLERLARMSANMECRIVFHGRNESLRLIEIYLGQNHPAVRAEYEPMMHWNELPELAGKVNEDHLLVIVTARKSTISYKNAMERLPDEVSKHFKSKTIMIIFPDQYGDRMDSITFTQPQHTEEDSAYETCRKWIQNKIR